MDVSLDDLIKKDREKGKSGFKGKKPNVQDYLIKACFQDQAHCPQRTQWETESSQRWLQAESIWQPESTSTTIPERRAA